MVNTYGSTKCPACGAEHRVYRPKNQVVDFPYWNSVRCSCGHNYKHSDVLVVEDVRNLKEAFDHLTKVAKECVSLSDSDWFNAQLKLAAAIDECEKMVHP